MTSCLVCYGPTKRPTRLQLRETSFALAFSHEVIVLAEIVMGTYQTEYFDKEQNDEQMCLNLDLLEEKREEASWKSMECRQRVARYYNQNVRMQHFRAGEVVVVAETTERELPGMKKTFDYR